MFIVPIFYKIVNDFFRKNLADGEFFCYDM